MALDREKIRADARHFMGKGSWDKALIEYQKLVVLEAGTPEVHLEMAEVYKHLGDNPKSAQALLRAGRLYERRRENEMAISLYEQSLALLPEQKDLVKTVQRLKESAATKVREAKAEPGEKEKKKRKEEKEKKALKEEKIAIPLFSELEEEEFREILKVSRIKHFGKDDIILTEGEAGDSIFFIVSGEVAIFKKHNDEEAWLNTLHDGDFFGEFAYFSKTKRQASAVATTDTEILEIKRGELDDLCERFPKITKVLIDFYKGRVLDTVVGLTPIFKTLQPHQRQKIISKFELSILPEGSVIIKEGTSSEGLYLIKSGSVNVITRAPDGREIVLARLKEFDFFGEVSLFMSVATTASVLANEEVRLMKLSAENFNWMIDEFPFLRKTFREFIEKRAESTIGKILVLYDKEMIKAV